MSGFKICRRMSQSGFDALRCECCIQTWFAVAAWCLMLLKAGANAQSGPARRSSHQIYALDSPWIPKRRPPRPVLWAAGAGSQHAEIYGFPVSVCGFKAAVSRSLIGRCQVEGGGAMWVCNALRWWTPAAPRSHRLSLQGVVPALGRDGAKTQETDNREIT